MKSARMRQVLFVLSIVIAVGTGIIFFPWEITEYRYFHVSLQGISGVDIVCAVVLVTSIATAVFISDGIRKYVFSINGSIWLLLIVYPIVLLAGILTLELLSCSIFSSFTDSAEHYGKYDDYAFSIVAEDVFPEEIEGTSVKYLYFYNTDSDAIVLQQTLTDVQFSDELQRVQSFNGCTAENVGSVSVLTLQNSAVVIQVEFDRASNVVTYLRCDFPNYLPDRIRKLLNK